MKKIGKFVTLICISLILMINAKAYLDPSVMTYTIQIVAGVVVTVGAVVGVYWRKMKKKLHHKLGVDENMKKEIEDDVIEIKQDD